MLRQDVVKVVERASFSLNRSREYTMADLITGGDEAEALRHYYHPWPGTGVRGQRATVPGGGRNSQLPGRTHR